MKRCRVGPLSAPYWRAPDPGSGCQVGFRLDPLVLKQWDELESSRGPGARSAAISDLSSSLYWPNVGWLTGVFPESIPPSISTGVITMPESIPSSDDDAQRAIQALSEKLDVPELKVLEVYKTEYRRLSAQSRIATFVSVLAMRNTRSILRDSRPVN